jgi:hypothetical protein
MVQLWIDEAELGPGDTELVDIVPQGRVPAGWLGVLDALDGRHNPVTLVHADNEALRRMAVFDAVVNNADRKGGHVLNPGEPNAKYHAENDVGYIQVTSFSEQTTRNLEAAISHLKKEIGPRGILVCLRFFRSFIPMQCFLEWDSFLPSCFVCNATCGSAAERGLSFPRCYWSRCWR